MQKSGLLVYSSVDLGFFGMKPLPYHSQNEKKSRDNIVPNKTAADIYYYNIRGMQSKIVNIEMNVSTCPYDIILIAESWLYEDIYDNGKNM